MRCLSTTSTLLGILLLHVVSSSMVESQYQLFLEKKKKRSTSDEICTPDGSMSCTPTLQSRDRPWFEALLAHLLHRYCLPIKKYTLAVRSTRVQTNIELTPSPLHSLLQSQVPNVLSPGQSPLQPTK
ncbi:uncharacterized protein BP01DRAFT_190536 [Aspergillus saccharolyticus JOP 1030-1]|uniref:Uncharacterized protein n=1 Tax=Aspergillus saccharolyticus JOP 1030-1 TaxID=1450539 RepID=A0A318Z3T5_9EURO|nr:hypothetical protein BP01DRAFT_190536 [Aspergillus saccharolyticus JOP 1030-1]PYH40977.1 hypothetical protein BP01DRAFT_190536 [Aspergillus saccharolyticus JOP 1030-1]